ncbi:hypothetical protein [Cohnella herbarum]|uniref:Uncharacterized protein n=1 Tax=Cohnella herbarum TaxID=2728023 RepID=A0A7Z2VER9_9BACL|nr:hypothetical protein [Cohnella herbarum]QJD81714.1 hypothetical protein HH215_07615 [Cohnella herbarum]
MTNKRKSTRELAVRMIGVPVCIELKDGSCYYGRIEGIDKDQLIFSGKRRHGAIRRRPSSKRGKNVKVSGLLPMFQTLMGAGAGLGGGGGGGNAGLGAGGGLAAAEAQGGGGGGGFFGGFGGFTEFMGFFNKAMPMVKMGMGMVKTIMPLLKGFGG